MDLHRRSRAIAVVDRPTNRGRNYLGVASGIVSTGFWNVPDYQLESVDGVFAGQVHSQ